MQGLPFLIRTIFSLQFKKLNKKSDWKRIFSTLAGWLLICLTATAQPANDDCDNAILLTPSVNLTCSNVGGSNVGVVSTNYDPCAEFEKRNVWYKFTATAGTHIVQLTLGTMQSGIINAFANGCLTLTHLNCGSSGQPGPVIQQILNGLTVGQEYLVAVATREESQEGSFDICILTPPPPANDECTAAVTLTVNASNTPTIKTTGTSFFASQSLPSCTGTADDDVWYNFIATQTRHRVHLIYMGNEFSIEAFSGSCGALVSIACGTPSGLYKTIGLNALTIGQTYSIRVYSFSNSASSQGSFQIALTSAPLNDECSNAIMVTPSANGSTACSTSIAGGTFDATQSGTDCFGGSSTSNDTWFNFTASQAVHTIKVHGFGSNAVRFEVLTGSCGTLSSLFCALPQFSGDTALTTLGNLTSGQLYYVRIYSGNSGGIEGLFNVCISSPPFPSNDECTNATNLLPASDSTINYQSGSTKAATNIQRNGSCNPSGLDVWYKFTATALQHVIKAINLTNTNSLSIELYSGVCNTLVHQRCGNAGDSLFGLGNLNIGQTYFIRIYSGSVLFGDDFQIAVFTPVALVNDECSNATQIIPTPDASCNEVSGTNLGATQSVNDNCDGNALIGNIKDVWYRFTASSASHRIRLIRGTGASMRFKLYNGTCAALNPISCSVQNTSNIIGAGIEQRFDGLIIGNEYLIRVFNIGFEAPGTFDLCVKTVVVPGNNECSTATVLVPQDNSTYGTYTFGNTTDATQSTQATLCSTGQDDDVWYQFTATQAGMKIVLQNSGIGATRLAVYSGPCTALVLFKCQQGNTRDNILTLPGLSIGSNYFVRVYSVATSGSQGGFIILVTTQFTPPANDDCINAVEIFPSTGNDCNATQGSTIDAAGSNATCINGNEVWYKFTATATAHRVNVEGFIDPAITVFSGTCAALVTLPSTCSAGFNQVSATASGLTIGNTYFVKVLATVNAGFSQSIFNICITTPAVPLNDLCSNAIALPVDNDASLVPQQIYSTNLAGFTGIPGCFAAGNDVWFSFVAPTVPVTIEVNAMNTNPGIELMGGSCGALNSIQCNGTNNSNLNNVLTPVGLQAGNTYLIRVSASNFSSPLQFKIKVYKALSPKINGSIDSLCLSGNLVQNPGIETDFFFPTSFVGAANPGDELVPKWKIPTRGTADFFNALNGSSNAVEIPSNLCMGNQSARNGYGYAGIFAYSSGGNSYREYLENQLSAPMIPGRRYLVSMYVSLSDFSSIAIDNIGMALRTTPTRELIFSNLNFTPQVISPNNVFVADKKSWVNISAVIVADQAYQYLVIGNFKNNAATDTIRVTDTSRLLSGGTFPGCAITSHTAYYFIDDVMVSEIDGNVSGCGLLPLHLLTFRGKRINETVALEWTTTDELNASHIEVQRSGDGLSFAGIGNVPAFNRAGKNEYGFNDRQPLAGTGYYRLKLVDLNGRFSFSPVIRILGKDTPMKLEIFPNPASDLLNLRFTTTQQNVQVNIFDAVGRNISSGIYARTSPLQVDVSRLLPGIYWIRVSDGVNTMQERFTKN